MAVVAVYNIKGGVGKTATAVNLAFLAARTGRVTLLCDLDPQASATFYFQTPAGWEDSAKRVVRGKAGLADSIRPTPWPGLDLLPADFSFRHIDRLLFAEKHARRRLAELLAPLRRGYSLILLDCPPGISLLAENVFQAADRVLVPVVPSPLSLRSHEQILSFFRDRGLPEDRVRAFFSMVEARKRVHRENMDRLSGRLPGLYRTVIPYLSDVERMGVARAPLPAFRPKSPAAAAYAALWREVAATLPP